MAHLIRLAYKFLSQHYVPGDRIFLFGFSRGAFAARSLAGFVDCVGLALQTLPAAYLDRAIDEAYFIYENSWKVTLMLCAAVSPITSKAQRAISSPSTILSGLRSRFISWEFGMR